MHIEKAVIEEHHELAAGGYRLLVLKTSRIASEVRAGQFVHVRIPYFEQGVLRRPFSVYWNEGDKLAILYKAVGRGTQALARAKPGETLNVVGPLGHGFPPPATDRYPVLVAGGYGSAALYLVARDAPVKGTVFIGARTRGDILCPDAFAKLGWSVRIATEDGSEGFTGMVTEALEGWLARERPVRAPEFFACGPNAMLKTLAAIAAREGWSAWVSLDRNMGCGLGACLTCVLKIRDGQEAWHWERCCREGPVFDAQCVIWDDLA